MMILHATGFLGPCYAPMGELLSGSYKLWALDQRNHGRSGKAAWEGHTNWELLVEDLLLVLEALDEGPWSAFGHSLGGGVLLLAEARRPGTFERLCLFEPVAMPTRLKQAIGPQARVGLAEVALKRRRSFASREAARRNYLSKPPFQRFHPDAFEAYLNWGLVDGSGGEVHLACEPEDEASVFQGALYAPVWEELPSVRAPVTVLGGDPTDDGVSLFVEQIAERLPCGRAVRLVGLDHFGPFVDPARVARAVSLALEDPACKG